MAGGDVGVLKRWRIEQGRGEAGPGRVGRSGRGARRELCAVDVVAGEVGFGVGFPGELDDGGGLAGGAGHGGETGRGGGGEEVVDANGDGGRREAEELDRMAIEGDGAEALGGVAVGVSLLRGSVEGTAGVGRVGVGGLEVGLGGRGVSGGGRGWGEEGSVEEDGRAAGDAGPLDASSALHGVGTKVCDGRRGGAGGGEGGGGKVGGAAGGVANADPHDQKSGRAGAGCGWEGEGGVAGAGGDVEGEGGLASGVGCGGGCFAELSGEAADEREVVGGAAGGGPGEVEGVADAAGGEVGHGLGKVERGRPGWAGVGAAGEHEREEKEWAHRSELRGRSLGTPAALRSGG